MCVLLYTLYDSVNSNAVCQNHTVHFLDFVHSLKTDMRLSFIRLWNQQLPNLQCSFFLLVLEAALPFTENTTEIVLTVFDVP